YTYSLRTHTTPTWRRSSTPFFFTHTPPTPLYTLSLHDALPISPNRCTFSSTSSSSSASCVYIARTEPPERRSRRTTLMPGALSIDRKSTRLNSSHDQISYAVFCLKKKIRCARRLEHAFDVARPR